MSDTLLDERNRRLDQIIGIKPMVPVASKPMVPAVVGDVDSDIQKLEEISVLGAGVLQNFTQVVADVPKSEQIKAYAALMASMTTLREKIIDAKFKKAKGSSPIQQADSITNNQFVVTDVRELNRLLKTVQPEVSVVSSESSE